MASQLITVENQSQELSPKDFFNLVWAVNYQVLFHYGRSSWVAKDLAPHGHLIILPKGMKPPVGAWNLIILDHSDQAGALGYHDDENGTGIPYAEVFAVDAVQDGATVSSVASHEALEMLVDPDVQNPRKVLRSDTSNYYIVEVGDPVQGNDYDVGAPEGKTTGAMVADFALPEWWGLTTGTQFSFRGSVKAPWVIAPQGYMSTAPENNPSGWTQVFGTAQDRWPKWASRLPRVHGLV